MEPPTTTRSRPIGRTTSSYVRIIPGKRGWGDATPRRGDRNTCNGRHARGSPRESYASCNEASARGGHPPSQPQDVSSQAFGPICPVGDLALIGMPFGLTPKGKIQLMTVGSASASRRGKDLPK